MDSKKPQPEDKANEESPSSKITSQREIHETGLIESDRIRLASEANHFIGSMVVKEVVPKSESGYGPSTPMTEEESRTYKAALSYLERQFNSGYSNAETYTVKVETEMDRKE